MEQFSKSIISEKNINNYVSAYRKDLTDELKTLNERILSIKDYYKSRDRIDFNERNKVVKKEVSEIIKRFISQKIIPKLVECSFFDWYKLKEKIDKKTRKVLHNYFD